MLNKWDYSGCDLMCFSDENQESYKKSAAFLGDSVEDWGCGTGWSKQYFKEYRGIDGSLHRNVDEQVDLREYTSRVDNILMRQVLECNEEWRKILENVKQSFKHKFCLVIYTPFVDKTQVGSYHTPVGADGTKMDSSMAVVEINFNKQDILDLFPQTEYKVTEEEIKTKQGYGRDWVMYVERI
jgi:hypothetical protein